MLKKRRAALRIRKRLRVCRQNNEILDLVLDAFDRDCVRWALLGGAPRGWALLGKDDPNDVDIVACCGPHGVERVVDLVSSRCDHRMVVKKTKLGGVRLVGEGSVSVDIWGIDDSCVTRGSSLEELVSRIPIGLDAISFTSTGKVFESRFFDSIKQGRVLVNCSSTIRKSALRSKVWRLASDYGLVVDVEQLRIL